MREAKQRPLRNFAKLECHWEKAMSIYLPRRGTPRGELQRAAGHGSNTERPGLWQWRSRQCLVRCSWALLHILVGLGNLSREAGDRE